MQQLPESGFIFWPVGTGDSTTVCVDKNTVLHVDFHHLECSDDEDDGRCPIVDQLVEVLPKRDKKPYLAVFTLTHPDQDHCRGFAELLKRVTIGEIWFSPRIFRENTCDLCDDACAFLKEAKRRVKATIDAESNAVDSSDRVRIIGYSELLEEDEFEGFPAARLHRPGETITELDGVDCAALFRTFLHAPFKDDDVASQRNETSLAMQIELISGEARGRALLLGDLSYPTVRRVFDESKSHANENRLEWDVLLTPHHCSKSVMYWRDPGDEEDSLKQDILDDLEAAGGTIGFIVASSDPIPESNEEGDCPPHAIAKARYEEIAPSGFLCTGEHPNANAPEPIVFVMTSTGLTHTSSTDKAKSGVESKTVTSGTLAAAIALARAGAEPPTQRVGFGVNR